MEGEIINYENLDNLTEKDLDNLTEKDIAKILKKTKEKQVVINILNYLNKKKNNNKSKTFFNETESKKFVNTTIYKFNEKELTYIAINAEFPFEGLRDYEYIAINRIKEFCCITGKFSIKKNEYTLKETERFIIEMKEEEKEKIQDRLTKLKTRISINGKLSKEICINDIIGNKEDGKLSTEELMKMTDNEFKKFKGRVYNLNEVTELGFIIGNKEDGKLSTEELMKMTDNEFEILTERMHELKTSSYYMLFELKKSIGKKGKLPVKELIKMSDEEFSNFDLKCSGAEYMIEEFEEFETELSDPEKNTKNDRSNVKKYIKSKNKQEGQSFGQKI